MAVRDDGSTPPGGPVAGGGWRLCRYEAVASTSDLCRAHAEAGEPGGLAILAGRQTAGRGSRGRTWESPSGGLYLSVLLRPKEPTRLVAQWALLAGVALVEAMALLPGGGAAALAGPRRLSLKWPNDLLLNGRKLGGVLLDSAATVEGWVEWVVVGIGVNLGQAPPVAGREVAGLETHGPDEVADAILGRLAHWHRIRTRDGFAPVRAAWLAHGPAVGAPITLKAPGGVVGGTFAGLGEDGTLLIQTGGRVHAFSTGEVLLADAAAG